MYIEKFLELATEGKVTINGIGEAMSLMQVETQMFLTDPVRGPYKGIDAICSVNEPFERCTHVEITRPVGAKILENQRKSKQSVYQEAYDLGQKKFVQAKKWSLKYASEHNAVDSSTDLSKLPENPNNVVIVNDLFDVPPSEKRLVQRAFRAGVEDKMWSELSSWAPIEGQPLIKFINHEPDPNII